MPFLSKFFGDANKKDINSIQPIIDEINKLEQKFERFTDEDLKKTSLELKNTASSGKNLDEILPEAFALAREAAKRTLSQRHFDVQLIGGIVLHQGKIAEMKTGEGKTLTATLAIYLNALSGRGAHVVTVNDYLARRDTVWMGQIYHLLGLKVGCINHDSSYLYDPEHTNKQNQEGEISKSKFLISKQIPNPNDQNKKLDEIRDTTGSFHIVHEFLRPVTRREAYGADITYGTNNEYGFDYLRDNMVYDLSQKVQVKGYNFAIVDEVDSILIDEARTPLIISAPDSDSGKLYETFSKIAPHLKENEHYNVDEKLKAVTITENGIEKVEKMLGVSNIYEEGGIRYVHHLEQALKASILFIRDRDYVVKNGEVIIVDEFTGRLMPGRRWSEGLHQAVEAKEGVKIQKESRTLATITFQNYFRQYSKLAGMTGTAATSAEEFHKVYGIDVIRVPTHKPMIRADLPDRIYKTENGKFKAIAEEIRKRHESGQPILVGTVSIQKNELLSSMLEREGIPHQVLNAKNHEREAEIIAQAGKPGAVTVATNMAGRGVDIMLGGSAPSKFKIENLKFKINEENSNLTEEYKGWEKEREKILERGGLHVIGTERHEARRIDNQLRGRSGRQGDSGSSQFFVSTEDEVARIFGGDRLKNIMDRLGVGETEAIENRLVSKAIEQAQSKIEGHYFDMRNHVLEYDDVMNRHRAAIYKLRNEILESQNVKDKVLGYIDDELGKIIKFHTERPDSNIEEIIETIKTLVSPRQIRETLKEDIAKIFSSGNYKDLSDFIIKEVKNIYNEREKEAGEEQMRHLEKILLLRIIDELWMDHLEAMEYLRDSVRLRAYGQRDPLVEYKIEGQKMFDQLIEGIKIQASNLIFKVGVMHRPETGAIKASKEDAKIQNNFSGSSDDAQIEQKDASIELSTKKIGRNDPCPCGAKKIDGHPIKYKHCHGKNI